MFDNLQFFIAVSLLGLMAVLLYSTRPQSLK